ncbi:MAG: flagellar hook-associated protein FlgK [Bacteroidetes bacterium]|nr:flagellar hook-associated protein FlgK [Bacteroidota bacterium]MCH8524210.1 flagellar hook-associated protein FlgK [Balneolales bacterium]
MRALFESAKSGMYTAERQLGTTAHNLVNANTPGYSRQRVETTPVAVRMGHGQLGLGVSVSQVNRMRNDLVDTQLMDKRMNMGYMLSKSAIFEQLQSTLASDTGGDLDAYVGRVFNAFSKVASDPQDVSVRNGLLADARQLVDKFHDMNRSIGVSTELAMRNITDDVTQVNNLLRDIASLNQTITSSQAISKPDFRSMDLQLQKLEELANLVSFEKHVSEKGSLELRIGGILVVDQSKAHALRAEINPAFNNVNLRLQENGKILNPDGGSLAGGIEMYTKEIPDIQNKLDTMASTIVTMFNDLHRQGFGLDDNFSRNFFDPDGVTAESIRLNPEVSGNLRNIAASSAVGESGNGDIAADIADIRNLVAINGRKMVDFAIELISQPGARMSELQTTIETREAELRMLEVQQERESGVNLDEELGMMIQFQNAYQGSARVLASAQQMYDTLLGLVR